MLKKKVAKFIAENKNDSGFDPRISVGVYRSALRTYIEKADKGFQAAHRKHGIQANILKIKTAFGETSIHLYRPIHLHFNKLASCVVYFTGSGFVYSSAQWQIRNCTDIAIATHSIVLNIEEKTAPEHKFPEGLNECFAVIKWLFEYGQCIGVDIRDIRLCGFSSGGNFAAVIARWCMEQALPIQGQYLISPWLDLTCAHDSYQRYAQGYLLDMPVCEWLRGQYARCSQFFDPDVSPLRFCGDIRHLAPCTLVVAECEPFHDEVIAYANKLQNSGVSVRLISIPGQIHEYAGCNRWRLISNPSEDPVLKISSAIQLDRLACPSSVLPCQATISPFSISSILYHASVTFFRRMRDEYITEHRHEDAVTRREYDERFGVVLFDHGR